MSASAPGLVFVSAGLGLSGGGTAAAGRLMAQCAQAYCAARDVSLAVLHLGASDAGTHGLPVTHFAGRKAALGAAVLDRQARRGAEVLFFDHPGPARVQALLPRPMRYRYGVYAHGIDVFKALRWDRARALREADVLLTNSEFTRRRSLAHGSALERAEVLPLALESRPPEGSLDGALLERVGHDFFLIVGRLSAAERYKGHDALIAALAALSARGLAAHLVIAGDGDDRARLSALTEAAGVADRVTFTGFVSETTRAALYERCSAVVMPSEREGFGLVYLEAMRAGRPVVALAGSAAEEIVEHEATGLLVASRDAPLENALERLLRDPGLGRRLGALGHERWQQRFSVERFARAFDRHLDRLREAA